MVAHVSMAHPVSPLLRARLREAAMAEGIAPHWGGTYVCMEGPQFSTYAESMTYKELGYSVIGMTNMPEAKLAREAEICYATVAMVTDFDCWHPGHDAVTVQDIIKVLFDNADRAKALVARLARDFSARARAVSHWVGPRARHPLITRRKRAIRRCSRSSTRWRAGCWAELRPRSFRRLGDEAKQPPPRRCGLLGLLNPRRRDPFARNNLDLLQAVLDLQPVDEIGLSAEGRPSDVHICS